MASDSFRRSVLANELSLCNHKGCSRPRCGINPWCRACLYKARLYGHPAACPLRPSLWTSERQTVQRLLSANTDHPGFRSVLSFLDGWLARATANDRSFKGARELARLARHGVPSVGVLTEVAALNLWLQRNPHALPDDRSRDFAVSRAVFGLAPRARRLVRGPGGRWPVSGEVPATQSYSVKPLPSSLAYVGQHLREVLGPFLANVAHSIELLQQQQADLQAAIRAPLRAPQDA